MSNTSTETLFPFVELESSVDNVLSQTSPNIKQSLLEFIDIPKRHLVDSLTPQTLQSTGPRSELVGNHGSGEMKFIDVCYLLQCILRLFCFHRQCRSRR